ncbi:12641_t:CDS:2 [Acaulospora morrowiae]|uniref:12641_t:CDS:1 n=1 Tax=Acaulospora morrowiae TaxID=94023 RepID=A0A9N8VLB1_9GLOM|nr:12641_t:CDS:2 [Acaulospora morrowiae]
MGKRGKRADHQGDESNQESDYTILSDNEDLYSYLKSDARELEALPTKEGNARKDFVYSDADDDNDISDYEIQGSFSRNDRDYTDYEMEDDDELFDMDADGHEEQESEPSRSAQISSSGATASNQQALSSPSSAGGNPAGASRKGHLKCRFTNCTESFIHKTALIVHERTHTGEKIYTCNYPDCNKQFHQRSYLKYHEQTHLTNSVFKCDVPGCTKQYRSRYTLISHKREHTGEKPFVCDVNDCGKAFSQRYQWISHKKLHEPGGFDSERDKGDKSGYESDQLKMIAQKVSNQMPMKVVRSVKDSGENAIGSNAITQDPKEECTSSPAEDSKRTTMLLKTEDISEFEVTKFVSKNSSAENEESTHFMSANRVDDKVNGDSKVSGEIGYMSNQAQVDDPAAEKNNSEEMINFTEIDKSFDGKESRHSENWISLDDNDEEIIDAPSKVVEVPDYFV